MRVQLTMDYPHELGYYSKVPLDYPEQRFEDIFALTDEKSCGKCEFKETCDHKVLCVETNTPLSVLWFEKFVSQFDDTPATFGKRCDYLIYDEMEFKHRIAFCELSCIENKYVEPNEGIHPEGKRALAYRQMELSLEALLSNNLLMYEIMTYSSKEAVFGWRERSQEENYNDDASSSMTIFMQTPDSDEAFLISQTRVMGHHFSFVEVKYPGRYKWNN